MIPSSHLADQRGGEPEIAVPALLVNNQEPTFHQLAEMPARSLRRHAADIGELGRG
jgi:hypothetical protein